MNIITISREFGSGGRELGKRLADELGFAYYDREIITEIAKKSEMDEDYIENILETGFTQNFPLSFARTFAYTSAIQPNATQLLVAQHQIIKEIATKEDCIIVGRNANIILKEYNPLNLFVYADLDSKIQRCREKAPEQQLSDSDLQKQIKQVDSLRAKQQAFLTNAKWGEKEGYHLRINTSNLSIKELTPKIADYAHFWFGGVKK